jgi:tetratricopeptide (TPR) repeat protein
MTTTDQQIEKYLNNELTTVEKTEVENKIKADKEFAREVEETAMLFNSFDEIRAEGLMIRLRNIEQELAGGKGMLIRMPVYLRWAAAILILAALSFAVYLNSHKSGHDLFLAYYTPYPNVENPASRSAGGRQAVWQHYENGDFAAAFQQFEQMLELDNTDLASRFYLGICALELNRLTVAEEALAGVAANENSAYYQQAQWYLALSYLKAGKQDATRKRLEEIIAAGSAYDEKAEALMNELE